MKNTLLCCSACPHWMLSKPAIMLKPAVITFEVIGNYILGQWCAFKLLVSGVLLQHQENVGQWLITETLNSDSLVWTLSPSLTNYAVSGWGLSPTQLPKQWRQRSLYVRRLGGLKEVAGCLAHSKPSINGSLYYYHTYSLPPSRPQESTEH